MRTFVAVFTLLLATALTGAEKPKDILTVDDYKLVSETGKAASMKEKNGDSKAGFESDRVFTSILKKVMDSTGDTWSVEEYSARMAQAEKLMQDYATARTRPNYKYNFLGYDAASDDMAKFASVAKDDNDFITRWKLITPTFVKMEWTTRPKGYRKIVAAYFDKATKDTKAQIALIDKMKAAGVSNKHLDDYRTDLVGDTKTAKK